MRDAIHKEIEKLKNTDVSDEELAMFKTRARADLLRGLADNQGLATALAEYQTRYGNWRELFLQLDKVDKVTKADIRRVANQEFSWPQIAPARRLILRLRRRQLQSRTLGARNEGLDEDWSGVRDQWSVVSELRIRMVRLISKPLVTCPFWLGVIAVALLTLLRQLLPIRRTAKPWEQIPVPKLHEFKPQQPKRIELKNGIVVFLQEDHELPFVSGSVTIPRGERDVDPAKAGLVSLYGQAWRTSGTAKMDGDAMDDFLEAKASHIETAGDVDSTVISWDSLKADSGQVFDLAMDLFFHPKFNADKLQLAQQQEATGIVRRNDQEGEIASREAEPGSWCMAPTARTRVSRNWRRSAP